MASTPVLTDVKIGITGVSNCEIFPYPIPDLFCGAPLIISGKFEGQFPSSVTLSGVFANNQPANFTIPATTTQYIPIDKVFIKNRLDLLTAEAWLTTSPEIINQIVALSCAENMPCAHTTMVSYETTPQLSNSYPSTKNSAVLVALTVGGFTGIVVLGATVAAFGNLAGSLANLSIVNTMQTMAHFIQYHASSFVPYAGSGGGDNYFLNAGGGGGGGVGSGGIGNGGGGGGVHHYVPNGGNGGEGNNTSACCANDNPPDRVGGAAGDCDCNCCACGNCVVM